MIERTNTTTHTSRKRFDGSVVIRFREDYFFLSNMYPASFIDDTGIVWPTSEHFYQAYKATVKIDFDQINQASDGKVSKEMAHKMPTRPDWDRVKLNVMKNALKYKFSQNPELAEKLEALYHTYLVEGNKWNDTTWGACMNIGQNHLGRQLMNLSKLLKFKKPLTAPAIKTYFQQNIR
ncbi:MAG: NADAR family protein [Lactobacillales bacterium]|jgi:ribA/ribD-fused uncharacterized protein|nr:NADAR family protein [Lactobacillales bacterium]